MVYSREHQIDMLLIYGECRKNARNAARLYQERFPDRDAPSHTYYPWLVQHLKNENIGDIHANGNIGNGFIVSEEVEINVLAYIEYDRTASVRELGELCNICHESARKILKKHGFKSFKYQIHHHLYENDFQRRLNYCNWFLNNYNMNPVFHHKIIFTDESRFSNLGMFNRNNTRYWARENQRLVREGAFQERFGVNVWLGVIGHTVIGPIFFHRPLNGEMYLEFLQNQIEHSINNLQENENLIYQQDGAPAHNSRIVANYLNERYGENWLGTNGPIRWPARSPDLTPLDFSIWGYLKEKVYVSPPPSLEVLENRIRRAIESISEQHLRNLLTENIRRIMLCQEQGGQRIEHLIE